MDDGHIMGLLANRLAKPEVVAALDRTAEELLAELKSDVADGKSTFRSLPLGLYGGLPPEIGSAWAFALRKSFAHPPERHPNSIQRMFAWGTSGEFEVWDGGQWRRQQLHPGGVGLSIPADSWHRAPALDEDWVVASFHTVGPNDLIEIVGDPASGEVGSTRAYLGADPTA